MRRGNPRMRTTTPGRLPTFACQTDDFGEVPPPAPPGPGDGSLAALVEAIVASTPTTPSLLAPTTTPTPITTPLVIALPSCRRMMMAGQRRALLRCLPGQTTLPPPMMMADLWEAPYQALW